MTTLIEDIENLLTRCDSHFDENESQEILWVLHELLENQQAALEEKSETTISVRGLPL